MTDEINEDPPDTEEPSPTIFDQAEGVDWLLAWIIGLAEKGLGLDITLHVQGQIVSGILISGRTYFEEIGNLMRGANLKATGSPANIKEFLATEFTSWKEIYPTPENIDPAAIPTPSFIHLKNATTRIENAPLTSSGTLWRGKLSSVDGFSLGSLSQNI